MTRQLIGMVILTAALLAGCGREDTTAANNAAAAKRATAAAMDRAAADTQAAADAKAAADAQADADFKAAANTKAAADQASQDAQAAADAKIAADLKAAGEAQAAADDAAKATSLLTQLTQYIKDNKVELAEKTLAQLDGMKGSLPASLQGQIETARTALAAKKAAVASQ